MSIHTRAASSSDYPRIAQILRAAFGQEDEVDLWSYLLAHPTLLTDADVRLALDGTNPVAVTVVQPRPIHSRFGLTPGAIVTLVACDPAVQGRGFGGAAVRDALARMAEQGIAAGILYGEADYYPRFGFAPVLTAFRTEAAVADLQQLGDVVLRPAKASDLATLAALYADAYDRYPCSIQRGAAPELWSLRAEHLNALMILPDGQGYALIKQEPEQLWIREAAAASPEAGRRLLAGTGREATARGLANAIFTLPPDHLITRLLGLGPSKQMRVTPKYGMVAVTDWAKLLPPTYAVTSDGLLLDGALAVGASQRLLTQLVMGYLSFDDLALLPDVRVTTVPAVRERLAADFPQAFPKWSLDPFWDGL